MTGTDNPIKARNVRNGRVSRFRQANLAIDRPLWLENDPDRHGCLILKRG
jgi:hypothetical protein